MDIYTGTELQLAARAATIAGEAERRRERVARLDAQHPTPRRRPRWQHLRLTRTRAVASHHAPA